VGSLGFKSSWGQQLDLAFVVTKKSQPDLTEKDASLVAVIGVIELKKLSANFEEAERQLTVYLGNCVAPSCRCNGKWNRTEFRGLALCPELITKILL
jgi:hypothetical protein